MTTKILVADDSATMRRVLEMTFAGEDAQVHVVGSASAALSTARDMQPDVVFCDASMPGEDGYALATQLRAEPALAGAAVILMASQHEPYDEGRGRAAGVDDHISKPFDTQSVIDRVSQVLARPRAHASIPPAAAPEPATTVQPHAAPPPPPPPPPAPMASAPAQHTFGSVSPASARPASPHRTVSGIGALSSPPAPPASVQPPAHETHAAQTGLSSIPAPTNPPAPVAAATAPSSDLAAKLADLGLTTHQVEGVLALSREVIEQVVWEVVPELAEVLIKEEIKRLTAD